MSRLILILSCLLMLSTDASFAEEKKPSIIVKGLYIGMDVEEVTKQIKLPEGWLIKSPSLSAVNHKKSIVSIYHQNLKSSDVIHGWIGTDEGGKVIEILLASALVNDMFQVEKMEASEFAKKFAEAYKIPSLKPTDSYNGWYYTSPEGYKIFVSDRKSIKIEKTLNDKMLRGAFD